MQYYHLGSLRRGEHPSTLSAPFCQATKVLFLSSADSKAISGMFKVNGLIEGQSQEGE
jgi:hypothetical protein